MCGEPIVTLSRQRLKRKCIILRRMALYLQTTEELFWMQKEAHMAMSEQAGEQAREGAEYRLVADSHDVRIITYLTSIC